MEEEKKTHKTGSFRIQRRVSFFRRRKKSEIRPFVKAKKQRDVKKLLRYLLLMVLVLFLMAGILYGLRYIVISYFIASRNTNIINPNGIKLPDNAQIKSLIKSSGLNVSNITFASDSADISFILNKDTFIYLTGEKNIDDQLSLVRAIDQQMTSDNKRAISIDLRYNKPIVKF